MQIVLFFYANTITTKTSQNMIGARLLQSIWIFLLEKWMGQPEAKIKNIFLNYTIFTDWTLI